MPTIPMPTSPMSTPATPRRGLAALGTLATLLLLAVLVGCEGAGTEQLFSLNERGGIEATLFVDLDLTGQPEPGDPRLQGRALAFRFQGVNDTVVSVDTGAQGVAVAGPIPVGAYRIEVPASVLGDSLRISSQTPDPVRVLPRDTASVSLAVSYFEVEPSAVSSLPLGRRVFVRGVALHASGALPGGAIHLRGTSGSLRGEDATGTSVVPGDSVRILGRVATRAGTRVLQGARVVRLSDTAEPPVPAPVPLATGAVGSADGGARAGDLVELPPAQVLQSATQDGTVSIRIDDGSGEALARIPSAHLTAAGLPIPVPGAVVRLTGILVPEAASPGGGGSGPNWVVRTRSGADVQVEAEGIVRGRAFHDLTGTGSFDQGDLPLPGLDLRLVTEGLSGTTVASATSDAQGLFSFGAVPVGSYRVELSALEQLPDSLSLRSVNPTPVVVGTGASASVAVAVGFPTLSPAAARALPEGSGVFVQGVVLNRPSDFGDGSVHLSGAGGALRVVDPAAPPLQPGDQVRIRGRMGVENRQPVLLDGQPFIEGTGGLPAPITLSSSEAARAAGATRDAQLVQVREATIVEIVETGEVWRLLVDDGSGPVLIRVRLAGVGLAPSLATSTFPLGRRLTVRGLLVPLPPEAGEDEEPGAEPGPVIWEIRPRTGADLDFP